MRTLDKQWLPPSPVWTSPMVLGSFHVPGFEADFQGLEGLLIEKAVRYLLYPIPILRYIWPKGKSLDPRRQDLALLLCWSGDHLPLLVNDFLDSFTGSKGHRDISFPSIKSTKVRPRKQGSGRAVTYFIIYMEKERFTQEDVWERWPPSTDAQGSCGHLIGAFCSQIFWNSWRISSKFLG